MPTIGNERLIGKGIDASKALPGREVKQREFFYLDILITKGRFCFLIREAFFVCPITIKLSQGTTINSQILKINSCVPHRVS